MTRYATVKVEPDRIVLQGQCAGDLAAAAGIRGTYNGVVRGWIVGREHLADLLASLDHQGVRVRVVEVPTG